MSEAAEAAEKTEEPPKKADPLEKDEQGFYDLTVFETPRFKYRIRDEATNEIEEHSIDEDVILADMKKMLPTAFVARELRDVDGNVVLEKNEEGQEVPQMVNGLFYIYRSSQTGEKLPEDLPNIKEVAAIVKRVFHLPEMTGLQITMHIFELFVRDRMQKMGEKKNMNESQDSQGSTQESTSDDSASSSSMECTKTSST